jgi:hypothetical protein
MAALSKAATDSSNSIDAGEQLRPRIGGADASSTPLTVASQIELLFSFAQSSLEQMQKNGAPTAAIVYTSSALSMLKPLLTQYVTMLNLLIRAGVEINGNPFLDDDTVLPEIRAFLSRKEMAGILHEAIPQMPVDQVEILEDLIGPNSRCAD